MDDLQAVVAANRKRNQEQSEATPKDGPSGLFEVSLYVDYELAARGVFEIPSPLLGRFHVFTVMNANQYHRFFRVEMHLAQPAGEPGWLGFRLWVRTDTGDTLADGLPVEMYTRPWAVATAYRLPALWPGMPPAVVTFRTVATN